LWQCFTCGYDLRRAEPTMDGHETASQILWAATLTQSKPPGGPSTATPRDYFSALWLVARLARHHQRLLMAYLPAQCQPPSDVACRNARARIEMLEVGERIFPIGSASWLLEDWPDRFVTTAKSAGITGVHLLRTESEYPAWLLEVLLNRLMLRNRWIGRTEVADAIMKLESRGEPVSKSAVRRSLGVTENRAIDELLDQRRAATLDELVMLCHRFEELIGMTSPARDQQRVLARDFLILLVSIFAKRKIEEVCQMTEAEVREIVAAGGEPVPADARAAVVESLLTRLHDQYAHGIRPFFIVRGDRPKVWFISRFGAFLHGHSVRDQITNLMKHDLDPGLWRSADVFKDSLDTGTLEIL
jgi:hypothetical protein